MTTYVLNRSSGEAIYSQICRLLEKQIKQNYQSGDFLPSEKELAERFSVNRHTLRRAIDELVLRGLVERQHGKGTMVIEPEIDYAISKKTRFTQSVAEQAETATSQVIKKIIIPAQGEVAKQLHLDDGEPVIWIDTLREVNGKPFCLISHFLPQVPFTDLEKNYTSGSLHDFIQANYNLTLSRSQSLITAILPRGDDATLLKVTNQTPVLRVKSTNINTENNLPVEFAVTRFRSDRVQLEVTL